VRVDDFFGDTDGLGLQLEQLGRYSLGVGVARYRAVSEV
jgi:hypothetical protein